MDVESRGAGRRAWRLEQVPHGACEAALEAADGFAVGSAFGAFALEAGLGLGVAAGAGDATRWMAVLIWGLPPRSRRWRLVLRSLLPKEDAYVPKRHPARRLSHLDGVCESRRWLCPWAPNRHHSSQSQAPRVTRHAGINSRVPRRRGAARLAQRWGAVRGQDEQEARLSEGSKSGAG
jgi:hypothetical protein